MKELTKTLIFVAVAAALAGSALWASIPRSTSVEAFNDQGEAFFPNFTNPAECSTLEIVEMDPETGAPEAFKVTFQNNRWVIPSHNDYPADAADRLAQTAARVIDLKKDTIRSSRTEDHKMLGVLDPGDKKTIGVDGVGTRITLRDKSQQVLADYILGKPVPGRTGQRFIRRPDQARTYGVNTDVQPSSRFADWIEPNLLQLKADQIRMATFVNQKVDAARSEIVPGETLTIKRTGASAPWTTEGLLPSEEVDPAKTSAMATALADLKIVGVRPKPQGLSEALQGKGDGRLGLNDKLSLQRQGFFLVKDRLVSEEGSLLLESEDGVGYVLSFGRVTFAKGEALSSGKGAKDDPKDEEKEPTPGSDRIESRYLMVRAQFDPNAIPKPTITAPSDPESLPQDVFARTSEEIKAQAEREDRELTAYNTKMEAGKKRAADLSARFAPWYYLVPGDAYRTLVLDRKSLIHPKPPAGANPGVPANPFGNGGGLPPGLRGMMPQGHP